jgi:hypothetical protein
MSLNISKKECDTNYYNRDGTLTKFYGHPLRRYLLSNQIELLCIVSGVTKIKFIDIGFPLVNQCNDSLSYISQILKIAEKKKIYSFKYFIEPNSFILYFFKNKVDEVNTKLDIYFTINCINTVKINKREYLKAVFSRLLIKNKSWSDIRGNYLHRYLYNKSIIPLPSDVIKRINKEIKQVIRTCRGEQIPFSSEKEYLLRLKIAKKMTNNFEKFDQALKEYKVKAKQYIEKTKRSKDFKQFCETVHSVPFKLNFLALLKEAKQEYLITPEFKKRLRSLK